MHRREKLRARLAELETAYTALICAELEELIAGREAASLGWCRLHGGRLETEERRLARSEVEHLQKEITQIHGKLGESLSASPVGVVASYQWEWDKLGVDQRPETHIFLAKRTLRQLRG